MFVGRLRELGELERRWDGRDAELLVLYGRRRVGKTALARHFAAGKPGCYFSGGQVREVDNLRDFAAALGLEGTSFESWDAALGFVLRLAAGGRYLLVLDEFQWLAETTPGLASVVQRWWDSAASSSGLFLVLSGSSIGSMEREVLGHKAPLFGRRTVSIRLGPLEPWEIQEFEPTGTAAGCHRLWGVLGGVPAYLERLPAAGALEALLIREAFSPGGALMDEVPFLVKAELREPSTYLSILSAIAGGSRRVSEIGDRCRLPVNSTAKYLAPLMELGLVERHVPMLDQASEKSRKGLYRVADPWTRFWSAFVLPGRSSIEGGHGQAWFEQRVLPNLPRFLGEAFEDACRCWMSHRWKDPWGRWPIRVGSHWSKGRDGSAVEFDLMAELSDGSWVAGECKATAAPLGMAELSHFKATCESLPHWVKSNMTSALFSLSGFTPQLMDAAVQEGILLVGGNEVFGLPPGQP